MFVLLFKSRNPKRLRNTPELTLNPVLIFLFFDNMSSTHSDTLLQSNSQESTRKNIKKIAVSGVGEISNAH